MDETSKLSTKPLVRGSKEHMDLLAELVRKSNEMLGAIPFTETDEESDTPQLQATFISKPRLTPKLPD